jgi:DNA-directed RNA polymerase specialized sigma24 family protein
MTRERPEAVDAFRQRFERPTLAYFLWRVDDPHAALDLTAETFAQVVLECQDGARVHDAASWLFAIARAKLADFERRGAVEARARLRTGSGWMRPSRDLLRSVELMEEDLALIAVSSALRGLPADYGTAVMRPRG